jgi:hypothetical protein
MLTASRDEYARFTRRATSVSKGDSIRKLGTLALAAKTLHAYHDSPHTETVYQCDCMAVVSQLRGVVVLMMEKMLHYASWTIYMCHYKNAMHGTLQG